MKYSTLLIDADETILDFSYAEHAAFFEAFGHMGLSCDERLYGVYSAINLALWKAYERGEIEKSLIPTRRFEQLFEAERIDGDPHEAAREFVLALTGQGRLIDGAREFLAWSSERFDLYAVTNGIKSVQRGRFAAADINKYMKGVFISEEIGFGKPDKRYFDRVLERIKENDPRRVVVIGDSLTSDIKGAVNAGLDSIWYDPKGAPVGDGPVPTYTAGSYGEIKRILE